MIRYDASLDEIRGQISNRFPDWLASASARTKEFRKAKAYREASPAWSQIKIIYMEAQHAKCAYCERKLESGDGGKIEWDIEHYRPKSNIKRWPAKDSELRYSFTLGSESEKGYYLLPYNINNYLTSCKVCNSTYKANFFPIAAKRRVLTSDDPARLIRERPFIPFPFGDVDDDPENILTFQGFVCVPIASSGSRRERALVTIDFFKLNDRDTLLSERSELILYIWLVLERLQQDAEDPVARILMETIRSNTAKHANCARSFIRTYEQNRGLAEEYVKKAGEHLKSKSSRQAAS